MNRVHVIIVAGALTLACVAIGAPAASAASFGRCVKLLEKETGKYGSQGCQEGQITHGNYEWDPAFGGSEAIKKLEFGLTVEAENVAVYAGSPAEITLSCTGGSGTGELSGDKEVTKVVLTLKGCKSPTEGKCTNTTEAETVESNSLEGVLGVWKAEPKERHNKIGLKLFAPSYGTAFHMKCGTTERTIQGAIIPMLPPDTPNKMSTQFELKFMHRGNEQQPEQFEGSMSPVFKQMIGGGGLEQLGVEATVGLEHSGEEMEINTTCTC